MTPDDRQRERMEAWRDAWRETFAEANTVSHAAMLADTMLAEFDKRFPAPSAAAPVEPVPLNEYERHDYNMLAQEIASLRQKARLWDAVASGKVRLYMSGDAFFCSMSGTTQTTRNHRTAEEAVEAAIAAGALK